MKESKAVNVRKRDLNTELNREYQFYATEVLIDAEYSPVYSRYEKKTQEVGCQYDRKRDNSDKCTCKYLAPLRKRQEVRYSGSPKQIYSYQGSRSYTDIGVGSVKALQRKKVKRIYLPETVDRGVGSSDLSTYILQRSRQQWPYSYYENKRTSSKCVGGILEYNIDCAINEKLSPIVQTISGSTSYTETVFNKNIEIGSSAVVKSLTNATTQVENSNQKDIEIISEMKEIEINHHQPVTIYQPISKTQTITIDQEAPKKMASAAVNSQKAAETQAKPKDKESSSDSLLQHVHNLENPSNDRNNHFSVEAGDLIENKLEMEYRNIFAAKSKSKDSKYSSHTSEMKSSSTLKRRFEALRRGLVKKDNSKKNAVIVSKDSSPISTQSRKDVSINSDPPSLEGRSFSNTKPYSPFETMYSQDKNMYNPKVSHYRRSVTSNKKERGSTDWSSKAVDDDSEAQGVRGMFKLWGKKFNLEEDHYKRRCTPKTSDHSSKNSAKKKTEGPKLEAKPCANPEPDEKKEGRKFFFFKNKKKSKDKPYKAKKGVTAGRCEVRDGLVINILGGNVFDPTDIAPEPEIIKPNDCDGITRKSWLKKFLTTSIDSRNSVKVRWNNNTYAPSSSTVFELMDNIYKDTSAVFRSKSQVTVQSSYKSYTRHHVNFVRQNIEAWMIPKTVTDRANPVKHLKPQLTCKSDEDRNDSMEVRISDQKWFIDKSKAFSHKIEVVLHSKNFGKPNKEESSEYLRIDIPKGFFIDSSCDEVSKRANKQSSDEEVFKIVEYETGSDSKKDKPTRNLNIDHQQNKIKVTVSVKRSKKCVSKVFESAAKKPTHRDVVVQGSNVYIPKKCDVIGVGIITHRDLSQIRKPILKIQDDFSDEESEHNLLRPHIKKCEFAESYLQEYYRHWTPLGIDLYSWCVSDSQLKCCSDHSRSSFHNQGDRTKSCPNIYEEFQMSAMVSSCGASSCSQCQYRQDKCKTSELLSKSKKSAKDDKANPDKRILPKDSLEVFKRRKIYAMSAKSKWVGPNPDFSSSPSYESKCDLESPSLSRPQEGDEGVNSTLTECPKLKNVYSRRRRRRAKHVSLPDCDTMNEYLTRMLQAKKPDSILAFKGVSEVCKKRSNSFPKHAKVNPKQSCEIPRRPCEDSCEKMKKPPCAESKKSCEKPPMCPSTPQPCSSPPSCLPSPPRRQSPPASPPRVPLACPCAPSPPKPKKPQDCPYSPPILSKQSPRPQSPPRQKPPPPPSPPYAQSTPQPCSSPPSCLPSPPRMQSPPASPPRVPLACPCPPSPPKPKKPRRCPFFPTSSPKQSPRPQSPPRQKPPPPPSRPYAQSTPPPPRPCVKKPSPRSPPSPYGGRSPTGSSPPSKCYITKAIRCPSHPSCPHVHIVSCPPNVTQAPPPPSCPHTPPCPTSPPPPPRCLPQQPPPPSPPLSPPSGTPPALTCPPPPQTCLPPPQTSLPPPQTSQPPPQNSPPPPQNSPPPPQNSPPPPQNSPPPPQNSPPPPRNSLPPSQTSPPPPQICPPPSLPCPQKTTCSCPLVKITMLSPCPLSPPYPILNPCPCGRLPPSPPPCPPEKKSSSCLPCGDTPPTGQPKPKPYSAPPLCLPTTPPCPPPGLKNPPTKPNTPPQTPCSKYNKPCPMTPPYSPASPVLCCTDPNQSLSFPPPYKNTLVSAQKSAASSPSKPMPCEQPFFKSLACQQSMTSITFAMSSDAPLYYSPIHPCPPKPEPKLKKPHQCQTSPCSDFNDDFPWPTKNQVSNKSSTKSRDNEDGFGQSYRECKKDCPLLPRMSCETVPSVKKVDCKPSCPNHGGSPRLPCLAKIPGMQCPQPPRAAPPAKPYIETYSPRPNTPPQTNRSRPRLSGLFLKMKPMKPKKSTCSKDCLAWENDRMNDDYINLNSHEKITIRLKKETPSTEEIREGLNIKVQDEDGCTLFERKDYRLQHAGCSSRPSLVGEMFKASEVRRVTTNSSVQAIGAEKDRPKEVTEVASDASVANLIEIQFKLKVTHGGNTTEIDIANDAENDECKEPLKKSKQEVFVVKNDGEKTTENSDQKNDINIRIVIKNFKSNSGKKKSVNLKNENYNDFSKNISAKFHTVSTGYSDDIFHDENAFSVHRATVDLTTSVDNTITNNTSKHNNKIMNNNRSMHNRSVLTNRSAHSVRSGHTNKSVHTDKSMNIDKSMHSNRSVEIMKEPAKHIGKAILMGSSEPSVCRCITEDEKSEDTEAKSFPSMKYINFKDIHDNADETTDTQLTDHKYEYNEDTDTEKPIRYDTEETDTDRQIDPPKYDTETDTEKPSKKYDTFMSTTDTDEPDTLPEIKKSLSLNSFVKPQTLDEKKEMLKHVMAEVHDNNYKNKGRMKKLKDMLKVILTSDSSDHDDSKVKGSDLAKDVTYASLKPNYFRDTDSMNNYYKMESKSVLSEVTINRQVVYPSGENNSDCSNSARSVDMLSSENESKRGGGCMCSTLAARLKLASRIGDGGGCCCGTKKINKKSEEITCDLKRESDYTQLDYKTAEFVDVHTQNSRYLTSKINSTNLSVHSTIRSSIRGSFNFGDDIKADSGILNVDSKQLSLRKTLSPERYHVRDCQMRKRNRDAIFNLSDEEKIVLFSGHSTRLSTGYNKAKLDKKNMTRKNASDILQSYEAKKAVLEIYAEKTFSDKGEHLVAKLPKFVYDREQEIQTNYEAMANNTYKTVCKKNIIMMAIKR